MKNESGGKFVDLLVKGTSRQRKLAHLQFKHHGTWHHRATETSCTMDIPMLNATSSTSSGMLAPSSQIVKYLR